jgi:hypothetical protein
VKGPRRTALLLAAWTLFVWITRARNALGDDDLSTAGQAGALALSASFVVLAGLVLDATVRHGERRAALVALLALWTVVVWPVRVVQIATADHGAGFVVVHVALGVISMALAVLAVRAQGGFSAARSNN